MLTDFLRLIKGFILVIGPREAGKTSILRRLATGNFEEQEPTIGFREEKIQKMRIIEIGGHQNFKEYWKVALEQNPLHTFYVIDVRHEHEYNEYLEFLSENKELHPQISQKTTLIFNKIDLSEQIPFQYKSESFILSSAKKGDGMFDILEAIARLKED